MSIVRAVEFRRYLLRSANSGVSMVVAPSGRVTQRLGLDEEGILIADIHLLSGRTFYDRRGDAPLAWGSLALLLAGALLARRHRS
jgi:apolipoprotein N-acyltransferase